ncbi:MAG: hypothetical protein ACR2QG_00225, partial [Gammaproteobacteria bacterium]
GLFTYLGNGYDFRFDFSDSTYQVCTEVIWREIDGKGNISFVLTERAGNPTLSADDIVNYYLQSELPAFEFVLYAEEAADSDEHAAVVKVGEEGKKSLQSLMDSVNKQSDET